jgi:hypothetical protein
LFKDEGKKANVKKAVHKAGDNPIFVIDEKKDTSFAYKTIDPTKIASITIEGKKRKLKRLYEAPKSTSGFVLIITKQYAVESYRPRFNEISPDYEKLVQNYSNEYDSIMYIADDNIIPPNVEGRLYNMIFNNIGDIKVKFPDEATSEYGDKAKFGVVIITSKKRHKS